MMGVNVARGAASGARSQLIPIEVSRWNRSGYVAENRSAPGDRRNDRNLGTVGDASCQIVEKPHVFTVHIDINESPQCAGLLAESGAEPGITGLHRVDHIVDGAGGYLDRIRVSGNSPQRRLNSNFDRHIESPILASAFQSRASSPN